MGGQCKRYPPSSIFLTDALRKLNFVGIFCNGWRLQKVLTKFNLRYRRFTKIDFLGTFCHRHPLQKVPTKFKFRNASIREIELRGYLLQWAISDHCKRYPRSSIFVMHRKQKLNFVGTFCNGHPMQKVPTKFNFRNAFVAKVELRGYPLQ